VYQRLYSDLTKDLPLWNAIAAPTGDRYQWDDSTYIARPPFFDAAVPKVGDIKGRHRRWPCSAIPSHRPHQPRRQLQAHHTGRQISARPQGRGQGLQQLRLASRQPRSDDARHLRHVRIKNLMLRQRG